MRNDAVIYLYHTKTYIIKNNLVNKQIKGHYFDAFAAKQLLLLTLFFRESLQKFLML